MKSNSFESLWEKRASWKNIYGMYDCPICGNSYSKYGIKNHIKVAHFGFDASTKNKKPWNLGLTKDNDEHVRKSAKTLKYKYATGEITHSFKNKTHSNETKRKISEKMKLAHKNGTAWNIGKSRWNNTMSYPEQFFSKVINNEFEDKNFIHEYPFFIYSLDFAWPHLKKCIEIDGDQHYRFKDILERDKRKDILLSNNSWTVLRIRWKDMLHEPQKWIKIAKDFIENDIEHLNDNLKKYQTELSFIEKQKIQKEVDIIYEEALKINEIVDKIIKADINFSKYGCIKKAADIIGISSQNTRNWLKRNGIISPIERNKNK